jgi:hypothetical protein
VAGSWGRRGSSTRGPPLKVLVAGSAALSSDSIEAMLKIDHRFRASVEHGIERLRPIFDMGLVGVKIRAYLFLFLRWLLQLKS